MIDRDDSRLVTRYALRFTDYIESEGTGVSYWGDYSKQDGLYNTISEFKPIIRNWTGMSSLSLIGGTFLSRFHILYVRFQLGNGIITSG